MSIDRNEPPRADIDVEVEIGRLYQLPLTEFIDARNQLANRLRKSDREAAARVRKLAKPSVSAWAVNQAYWKARADFDSLIDAGETLRTMQKKALSGEPTGDLQSAMDSRLQAMAAVMKHAEQALDQGGHGSSNATMRRVSTTLEALAAYGRADSAPPVGRLVADVPAPGFDALTNLAEKMPAGAVAPAMAPSAAARDAPRRAARKASLTANDNAPLRTMELMARQAQKRALEAVAAARADLETRKREFEHAQQAENQALECVYAAEKDATAAQEQLAMAITARNAAVQRAEQSKRKSEKARRAVAQAEEALAAAQKRVPSDP